MVNCIAAVMKRIIKVRKNRKLAPIGAVRQVWRTKKARDEVSEADRMHLDEWGLAYTVLSRMRKTQESSQVMTLTEAVNRIRDYIKQNPELEFTVAVERAWLGKGIRHEVDEKGRVVLELAGLWQLVKDPPGGSPEGSKT